MCSVRNARGATRMRVSRSAAPTKEAASIASAIPGLPATTITPPTAGPTTKIRFRIIPRSAFASWSRSSLTVCGTRPVSAGITNASAAP